SRTTPPARRSSSLSSIESMTVLEDLTTLSDDELRARVDEWLVETLPSGWLDAIQAGDAERLRALRKQLDYAQFRVRIGEAGWATPTWPREYGGAGIEPRQAKVVNEELTRFRAPRSFNIIGIGMAGPTIMHWGTEEQKLRYLPPMAQDREIWCQLFSEPGAGSDVAGLATRAVRDGDEWVVNGQKVWTTLAHVAAFGMLVARTDPDQPKHKGLTYFIVDMKAPGAEVRPPRQMTGDAGVNEGLLAEHRTTSSARMVRLSIRSDTAST